MTFLSSDDTTSTSTSACADTTIEFIDEGFEDTYLVILSAIPDENEDEVQIQWPETLISQNPACSATV